MKRVLRFVVLTGALAALEGALVAGQQPNQNTTYIGYNNQTDQIDKVQKIVYQYPDPAKYGSGPYPLFVYAPATFEPYSDPLASLFISLMADRGFLSASAQYYNYNTIQTCSDYTIRASAVFDAKRSTSAVSVLCALPNAGCSTKGIVTLGYSQGAAMSILAKNYAPNVKASVAMSMSAINNAGVGVDLTSCLGKSVTAIPADKLMVIAGENDPSFGNIQGLQLASGYTCPQGSTECWAPTGTGAGWYFLRNSEVTDLSADHCYTQVGDCGGWTYDSKWATGTYDWSMKPNLDWLASFGTKRVWDKQ